MLKVRLMQLQDVPEIHAIEILAYKTPWSLGIMYDCVRVGYDCRILELIDDKKTVKVGYIISRIKEGVCHILNLCIANEFQNQGMGTFLLKQVLHSLQNRALRWIVLEVRFSNTAALALYKSFGFECTEIKKSYYKDMDGEEDALVLRKILQEEDHS